MNSKFSANFKRILLTLSLLFFGAETAFAQCNNKTVYIQLPEGWGPNIYVYWEGQGRQFATTQSGRWATFTISGLPNDNNATNGMIFYKSTGAVYNDSKIGNTSWNTTEQIQNTNSEKILCSAFGGGDVIYVSESPTVPGRTVVGIDPPDAYYFYFLPPADEDWTLSSPYLVWDNGNGGKMNKKMDMDPDKCGWYRLVYFNEEPPSSSGWIWPKNVNPKDQLGVLGMLEDPTEWVDGAPTPFNLLEQFNSRETRELYFMPGDDPAWRSRDPNVDGICKYDFAAIIYDTDRSVNPSFTLNTEDVGAGSDQYGYWTSGLLRGMVKSTLNPTTRKIECANCTTGAGSFKSEADFNNAFDPESNTNVLRCYDMPFERNTKGLWEFDSDKMLNDQGKPVGGFFPKMLQSRGTDDYSKCTTCDTKYKAESFVNLTDSINPWCFERGFKTTRRTGEDMASCGTAYGNGDFAHGGAPANTWGATPSGGANWNGDWRNSMINLWGGSDVGANAMANAFFCFESHADFTYEKGQEFFFRGDDDIWVYINNQLVIDLGGSHLAAPGFVELDKLSLTEGEKYPIDIFFCDRRTTMSNVRISTNLYFSQESGLKLKESDAGTYGEVCWETSGGGSCSAVMGTGGDSKSEKCGSEIKEELKYYIVKRGTANEPENRTYLNESNDYCNRNGDKLVCYGGAVEIGLDGTNKVGVYGQGSNIVGTYVVYMEIVVEDAPPPKNIGRIWGATSIDIAWGRIMDDEGKLLFNTSNTLSHKTINGKAGAEVVASRLFPLVFADGAWTEDPLTAGAEFTVDVEKSRGASVRVSAASFADAGVPYSKLLAFEDSLGRTPADLNNLKIGNNGILVLWFTGTFEADDIATYEINTQGGAADASFLLKVHQPKIEFIDSTGAIIPRALAFGSDPTKGRTASDRSVYIAKRLERNIAAYDPTTNDICATCNFAKGDLNTRTWLRGGTVAGSIDGPFANNAIEFDGKLDNGLGSLSLTGRQIVDGNEYAFFTVGGPSMLKSTFAQWDSLQFREPPVPIPQLVEIFDDNGDGIGDRMHVVYNRPFPSKDGAYDSLPNALQIIWSNDMDTIVVGHPKVLSSRNSSGEYSNESITITESDAFWKPMLGLCADRKSDECGDTIKITGMNFSEEYKTARHGGDNIYSWSTFEEDGVVVNYSFEGAITDKIPAIVVRAEYEPSDDSKCGTESLKCRDRVYLELSEPVVMADGKGQDDAKLGFAYRLLSAGGEDANVFKVHEEGKSLPTNIRWRNNQKDWTPDPDKGDSSVQLTYMAYKSEGNNNASLTPLPNDSVKFANLNLGSISFKDLVGNEPNPKEIGRRLDGRARFNQDKNLIASYDPATSEDELKKAIDDMFAGLSGDDKAKIDELFKKDDKNRRIELLPVPESWKGRYIKDSISAAYPGTVGPIFWHEARNVVETLLDKPEYREKGITKADIVKNLTFVANSVYHTNLGNYVVKSRDIRVKCDDPIFKIDGQSDCLSNNGLYMGWDLKDEKGRWAGTGAYVQVYNFRWEVHLKDKGLKKEVYDKYPGEGNKVEMYGVKRIKSK